MKVVIQRSKNSSVIVDEKIVGKIDTTNGICDTLILVPDDITLSKFQKVAEPLYEKIFNNNNENEILEQLKVTLLPKLMNREIDLDKIETK